MAALLGLIIVLMSALSGLPAYASNYRQYGANLSPGGFSGMHFWNSEDNYLTFCQLQFDKEGLHAWPDKTVARPGEHFDAQGRVRSVRHTAGGVAYQIFGLMHPDFAYQLDSKVREFSDRGAREALAAAEKVPDSLGARIYTNDTYQDIVMADISLKNYAGSVFTGSKYPVKSTIDGPGIWDHGRTSSPSISDNGTHGFVPPALASLRITPP